MTGEKNQSRDSGVRMARILNGDHRHVDHWQNIAGYATLAPDRLEGKVL